MNKKTMCLLRSLKRHSSSVEWEKVNVGRRSEWNLCHLNKTSVFSFNSDLTFLRHPWDRAGTLGCWWISHRHVNWTKGTFTNIYYSGVFFPSPLLQNCLPDDKQCLFFQRVKHRFVSYSWQPPLLDCRVQCDSGLLRWASRVSRGGTDALALSPPAIWTTWGSASLTKVTQTWHTDKTGHSLLAWINSVCLSVPRVFPC